MIAIVEIGDVVKDLITKRKDHGTIVDMDEEGHQITVWWHNGGSSMRWSNEVVKVEDPNNVLKGLLNI